MTILDIINKPDSSKVVLADKTTYLAKKQTINYSKSKKFM